MAIVKMKRLRMVAMSRDREELLRKLQHLGCVELTEPETGPDDPLLAALTHPETAGLTAAHEEKSGAERALGVLKRYAPVKSGMLAPKPGLSEGDLLDEAGAEQARVLEREVNGLDRRLAAIGCELGLVSREEYEKVREKYAAVDREVRRLEHTGTPPSPALTAMLEKRGEPPVKDGARLADLLRRPRLSYADLAPFDPDRPDLPPAVVSEAEITIKYAGYINRQLRQVEEVRRLEERPMPEDIDYLSIEGLRLEARQKLAAIRPRNLGQAGRVSGVSPADVAVLMVYLKQNER